MKYSKEFIALIAHINPALFDVIFPMGPLYVHESNLKEFKIGDHATKGSIFGTDMSGDLKVFAKFSWKMRNLTEQLRSILVQSKLTGEREDNSGRLNSMIQEVIDDYCGNGIIHFPPKPRWMNKQVTVEEKVGAAILLSEAASAVDGTELETMLSEGADKILDSAIAQVGETENKSLHLSFDDFSINA